jgi:uncharacterized protein YdhG (YjbR/CyaY superfamily)
MADKRPTTVAEYIAAAPPEGRAMLKQLHALLKQAAPRAKEAIKWGNPFFVEPRFVFAFSAHKAHLSFAPGPEAMAHFREELKAYATTKHFLKVPYVSPLPEDLIQRMARYCVATVAARQDDGFWSPLAEKSP